jgi:glutathione S-transferase
MYKLHIANKNYSSWSLRPWVLMKELGLGFEECMRPFEADDNFEKFRAFSPTGKVPCLVDGDTTIWDSLAITEYLAERHEHVWPGDAGARVYARCVAAEMHSGFDALRSTCPMNCAIEVAVDSLPPRLQRDQDRIDELWTEGLMRFGGEFLAGAAFTAADAFFCPVAFRVRSYRLPLSGAALAYSERLLALPSMIDWDRAAIREAWIERQADEQARALGTIIADRRHAGE